MGVVRFALVRLKLPALGSMKTIEKLKKKNRTLAVKRKVCGSREFARVRINGACTWRIETNKQKTDSVLPVYPQ